MPERVIKQVASLDQQARTTAVNLFANSSDTLQVVVYESNGVVSDFTEAVNGSTFVPAVCVLAGSNITTAVYRRGNKTLGGESQLGVSFGGVALPAPGTAPAGISAENGVINIEIQETDFTNEDVTTGCWLELWLVENKTTPAKRILAAVFRVSVVATGNTN